MLCASCTVVYTVSYGLTRSCTIAYTIIHGHRTRASFLSFKNHTRLTLEWPKCKSDKATVYSVVCTVYTGGQPCKPCVLCEMGFRCNKYLTDNLCIVNFQGLNTKNNIIRFMWSKSGWRCICKKLTSTANTKTVPINVPTKALPDGGSRLRLFFSGLPSLSLLYS